MNTFRLWFASSAVFSLSLSRSAVVIFVTPLIISMITPFVLKYSSWRTDLIPILIISLFFVYILGQQRKIFEAWYMNFQKKEELNTIFEKFPGGMGLLENEKIIKMNEQFKEVLQISNTDQLSLSELNQPEQVFLTQFYQSLEEGDRNTITEEINLKNKNSESTIYLLTAHRISQYQKKFLVFLVDISELKKTQQLVEQQKVTLLQSSKLVALGEMSNGIAHEINTPLAIICAKSQQIHDRLAAGAPVDINHIVSSFKKNYGDWI